MSSFLSSLDSFFGIKKAQSTVQKEVTAGLTTFLTMSYILFVNPFILSKAGIPPSAAFIATVLSAAGTSILMGIFARWPVALAPGMGTNAWFSFGIVGGMGIAFPQALGAVFISGILMVIVSILPIRRKMFEAVPQNIRWGIVVGIGLFITMIGFKESQIIVANPATLVSLGHLNHISPIMTLLGLILIHTLRYYRIKGAAFLICILFLTLINILMGNVHPDFSSIELDFSYIGALSFDNMGSTVFLGVVVALFLNDFLDSSGTLMGIMTRISGKIPPKDMKKTLIVDGIGTVFGSILGTSTVTSYAESNTGVEAGGRTGLVAVTVGLLFLIFLPFYPLLQFIPSWATAPVLISVGLNMLSAVHKVDFKEKETILPAFLAMLIMPFSYSVLHGIGLAMLVFFVTRVLEGKIKDKQTFAAALIGLGYVAFLLETGTL